jgi:DNA-directed RNA polymerase I subunit RPA1
VLQVVTNYVEAVGFSFYTDEEKHSISVKQITSPVLFDNLKNPVVGGLYDPALGPLNQQSTYFLHSTTSLLSNSLRV